MSQSTFFDKPEPEAPAANPAGRVSVLVPYPVDKAYSYSVPDNLELTPGDYVTVPLGSRNVTGVVWDAQLDNVPSKKIKSVIAAYDFPPMPDVHRKFIEWLAHYNMAPLGFVLKMALPVLQALEPPKPITAYILSQMAHSALSTVGRGLGEGHKVSIDPFKGKARPAHLTQKSRDLRRDQTDVEKDLWYALNNRQLHGHKFRRQYVCGDYIADFACPEQKLIVELDGGQHAEQKDYDAERTAYFEGQGFKVLRFWNNEVIENKEGVLQVIADALSCPSPNPVPTGERALKATKFLQNLSPQRRRVLEILLDDVPRRASELAEQAGCSASVVKAMAELGLLMPVDIHSAAPCRNPDLRDGGVPLSDAQRLAADHMAGLVKQGGYHGVLLDGVTGAGKTEVYFEAVAEALRQGKQALILLPEIALSNAFLDRFRARFGCKPALWHSQLSAGQRKLTWRGVADGNTKVIVGARSALMLPYADLGVIIIDEEHDPAYKQEDGVIYNARDMAVVRAHLGKIPVVLVSATPSLETITNAWTGRYEHLHLPDRFGGAGLPQIHVIDMKVDKPARHHFIAPGLHKAITENLERGEQSLLFLNRRGYAPLTLCRTCGHRVECPRCTAWLVEHKKGSKLQCHHCGYSLPFPKECPECHDKDCLAACGPGVERILEEITAYFPEARTVVLASDTTDSHEDLAALLKAIRNNEYDIIIGTQIIAKGHHFPQLTLVGIVDADLGLQGGDLRAAERSFQLLHQVAGRAGREQKPGHVFLQTWMPEHKVMKALASNERNLFLEVEAYEREQSRMPPYTRLAGIIISGKDEQLVTDTARELGRHAPQAEGVQTLGPAEAPFYRLRGNYRRRLLVRADKKLDLQKIISAWMENIKIPSTIRVYIDIDPQSFL